MKKRLIVLLSSIFFLLSVTGISSENGCTYIEYYSEKSWVKHENLIDIQFSNKEEAFVNSHGLSVSIHAFGPLGYPKRTSYANINGSTDYVETSDGSSQYFQIFFGKSIQIKKVTMKMFATKKDGTLASFKIYENSSYSAKDGFIYSKLLYSSKGSKQPIVIYLSTTDTKNLMIQFDDPKEIASYTLSYFQIDEYLSYDHVSWTRNYIANTDISYQQVCYSGGQFTPNGSSWQKTASTNFYANAISIFDYTPQLYSVATTNDWNKLSSFKSGSNPGNSFIYYDTAASSKITSWTCVNNMCYAKQNNNDFIYFDNNTKAAKYIASQVHWIPNGNESYSSWGWGSYNTVWCADTTGKYGLSYCQKESGHHSIERYNTFDIIAQYYHAIPNGNQKIASTKYSLITVNSSGTQLSEKVLKTVNGDETKEIFTFDQTGYFKIKAIITDVNGNQVTKISNVFKIDQTLPTANFKMLETMDDYLKVRITPVDEHSGIAQYRYSISLDEGKTYSGYSEWCKSPTLDLILNQPGKIIIKVELYDLVGNSNIVKSEVYILDKSQAVCRDLIAPVYTKYDESNLYLTVECADCTESTKIEVFQDNQLIRTENELILDTKHFVFNYEPNKSQTSLKVVVSLPILNRKSELSLVAYEKSYIHLESALKSITFNEIVASAISQGSPQKNLKETIILNLLNTQDTYYAGEAIKTYIELNYQNECSSIENGLCQSLIINSLSDQNLDFTYGSANASFEDGVDELRSTYLLNQLFVVPLTYNQSKATYQLPDFLVAKKSGKVYSKEERLGSSEDLLEADNSWFTDLYADKKQYHYFYSGEGIGVNQLSWKFNQIYEIDRQIQDMYKIRFLDESNPFPNGAGSNQQILETWLKSLNFEQSSYSFTSIK